MVLTNGTASAPFSVQAQAESPSFFVFNCGPYIAATHLNGSLIGPTSLYPGYSTPAMPGETIVLSSGGAIGNEVSNYTVVPVVPSGTRTCTPSNSTFTSNLAQQIATSTGPITHGEIDISRQPNINAQGQVSENVDYGKAAFITFTVPAALQPFIVSYIDDAPAGTCAVYSNLNGGQGNYLANLSGLDAGPSIKVTGPNGSQTIPTNGAGHVTLASGTFLSPGAYTFTGAGGAPNRYEESRSDSKMQTGRRTGWWPPRRIDSKRVRPFRRACCWRFLLGLAAIRFHVSEPRREHSSQTERYRNQRADVLVPRRTASRTFLVPAAWPIPRTRRNPIQYSDPVATAQNGQMSADVQNFRQSAAGCLKCQG